MDASPATDHGRRDARRVAVAPSSRREVSAIGIARTRRCSRAACNDPAISTLVFSYEEQVARLVELLDEAEPQAYDLCGPHADRTSPPRGWELSDTRPPTTEAPRRLDDDDTVAVIAAVLHGDDTPRRVDVIDGGDAPAAPRRVTRVSRPSAHAGHGHDGHGHDGDTTATDDDPLRAALEELQRVVVADDDAPAVEPVPLGRGRRIDLPPPPTTPPPAAPPRAGDDGGQDRPTLW